MPLVLKLSRALPIFFLLLTAASSQSCYYPDGTESNDDIPCGSGTGDSSCCGSSAFCLDNGLCFADGVVSRGSCTDKTWGSNACAGYCKTSSSGSAISITPCPSKDGVNTFACGIDSSSCDSASNTFTMTGGGSFVLRPSQVADLVQPAIDSQANSTATSAQHTVTVTAGANPAYTHTSGEMAGLAIGLLIPFFIASFAAWHFYRRTQETKPKLMYPLPDDVKDEFSFRPPPPIHLQDASGLRSPTLKDGSDTQSLRTMHSVRTAAVPPPAHMMSFMERYQAIKENLRIQERAELDAGDTQPYRYELGDRRNSVKSTKSARSFQSTRTAKSFKSMISRGL